MNDSGGGAGWKWETPFGYLWLNEGKVRILLLPRALMDGFDTACNGLQTVLFFCWEEQAFNPPKILGLKVPSRFPQFLKYLNQSYDNNLIVNILGSLKKRYFYMSGCPFGLQCTFLPSLQIWVLFSPECSTKYKPSEIYFSKTIFSLTSSFIFITKK